MTSCYVDGDSTKTPGDLDSRAIVTRNNKIFDCYVTTSGTTATWNVNKITSITNPCDGFGTVDYTQNYTVTTSAGSESVAYDRVSGYLILQFVDGADLVLALFDTSTETWALTPSAVHTASESQYRGCFGADASDNWYLIFTHSRRSMGSTVYDVSYIVSTNQGTSWSSNYDVSTDLTANPSPDSFTAGIIDGNWLIYRSSTWIYMVNAVALGTTRYTFNFGSGVGLHSVYPVIDTWTRSDTTLWYSAHYLTTQHRIYEISITSTGFTNHGYTATGGGRSSNADSNPFIYDWTNHYMVCFLEQDYNALTLSIAYSDAGGWNTDTIDYPNDWGTTYWNDSFGMDDVDGSGLVAHYVYGTNDAWWHEFEPPGGASATIAITATAPMATATGTIGKWDAVLTITATAPMATATGTIVFKPDYSAFSIGYELPRSSRRPDAFGLVASIGGADLDAGSISIQKSEGIETISVTVPDVSQLAALVAEVGSELVISRARLFHGFQSSEKMSNDATIQSATVYCGQGAGSDYGVILKAQGTPEPSVKVWSVDRGDLSYMRADLDGTTVIRLHHVLSVNPGDVLRINGVNYPVSRVAINGSVNNLSETVTSVK